MSSKCLSVRLYSVTFLHCDHINWNSRKVISRINKAIIFLTSTEKGNCRISGRTTGGVDQQVMRSSQVTYAAFCAYRLSFHFCKNVKWTSSHFDLSSSVTRWTNEGCSVAFERGTAWRTWLSCHSRTTTRSSLAGDAHEVRNKHCWSLWRRLHKNYVHISFWLILYLDDLLKSHEVQLLSANHAMSAKTSPRNARVSQFNDRTATAVHSPHRPTR